MKSKLLALVAIAVVVGFAGCTGNGKCYRPFGGLFAPCADACCDSGCDTGACDTACCPPARCGLLDRCNAGCAAPAAPPTGAVAYPYYTNRGPRDFLTKNPPSIGP